MSSFGDDCESSVVGMGETSPDRGDYDYVTYLKELDAAGYTGFVTVEISVMVQRKPGYDPLAAAWKSYDTMMKAAMMAGIEFG